MSTAPVAPTTPRPQLTLVTEARSAAACDHHLWGDSEGLRCVRSKGHADGHEYHDPTGSFVEDDDESGHG